MIRIDCPVCGLRDETEFTYGADASVTRPSIDDTRTSSWMEFIFMRDNPRGNHLEYWHHVQGCRQWLVLERNTANHETGKCKLAAERVK